MGSTLKEFDLINQVPISSLIMKEISPKSNKNRNKDEMSLSREISNELVKAIGLLKTTFPNEFTDNFFAIIMKDIVNLLEILEEITVQATSFSTDLKQKVSDFHQN